MLTLLRITSLIIVIGSLSFLTLSAIDKEASAKGVVTLEEMQARRDTQERIKRHAELRAMGSEVYALRGRE